MEGDAELRLVLEGYRTVTPWIISRDTACLLGFVAGAFGAEEMARVHDEDGAIGHTEFVIGASIAMAFDAKRERPETPSFLRLYVEDGDAVYRRAPEAGAVSVTEMTELFFGDRVGRARGPEGNLWWIQTRLGELDPEERARRAEGQTFVDAMWWVQESLDRELRGRMRG